MSETAADIAHSEHNAENVYIVGVRLWPDSHDPDCFCLVLYNEVARGDRNRPLTHSGHVIFFRSAGDANRVLKLGDPAFRKYAPISNAIAYVYDVPALYAVLSAETRDEQGIVADFINELLDFASATGAQLPSEHYDILAALADSTTFDKDLAGFFRSGGRSRKQALDAVAWSIGAILLHAQLIA